MTLNTSGKPMTATIIDTDAGFAPDDTIALLLALNSPELNLKLVVTGDEVAGKRYRFVRHFLELAGREDLRVVEGIDQNHHDFLAHEFIQDFTYPLDMDYLGEMKKVVDASERVKYIGMQGFTNLANYFQAYPADISKFDIFQMGGSVKYVRRPGWIEHNMSLDPKAAREVLRSGTNVHLITADTTFQPEYEMHATTPFFQKLVRSRHPLHQLVVQQCVDWYEAKEQRPFIHDPVTVAAALQQGVVEYYFPQTVEVSSTGQLSEVEEGPKIYISRADSHNWKIWRLLEERVFS